MRRRSKIILVVLTLLAVSLAGFIVWAETPLAPMQEAFEALKPDPLVDVSIRGDLLIFTPRNVSDVGLIFYPGGRIDYRSYAPLAHAIAARGYLVVIVKMPLNLAVLGSDKAQGVINNLREIRTWVVGGHSLGGSMAAQFVSGHPDEVRGLVLYASYPASNVDLSMHDIAVVTIHGSRDAFVKASQIEDSLKLLPADTVSVEIFGGNHSQFGWYGLQPGDNEALIDRLSQQRQIVEATVSLLKSIS